MRGRTVCAALVAGCVIAGLAYAPPPPGKGGGGGGGGGSTPLCISFANDPGDRILSDDAYGAEVPYCDDSSAKIKAEIRGQGGILVFESNSSKKRVAGRTVFVDFSLCADEIEPCNAPNFPDVRFDDPVPPGDIECCGYPDKAEIMTGLQYEEVAGAWVPLSNLDLREMEVGVAIRVGLTVQMVHTFDGQVTGWFLRYRPVQCADSSPVTITRLDTDMWEIVASETDVACLERGQAHLPHGYYHVPFRMTLWVP